jgi:hypothetical protein
VTEDTSRRRRRRRRGRGGGGERAAPATRRTRRGWRETIDSFGGFLTIGAVGGAVLVVVILVLRNPLASVSEDALLGEAPPLPARSIHTSNPTDMIGRPGEPPAGGPHFAQPQRTGIYDEPVPDGNAVHSLEHGIVWITYNPELLSGEAIDMLENIADDFRRDVILSPRPQNSMAVAAVSWGRVLSLDAPDEQLLKDFIRTNRDRSPEPGIR